MEGLSEKALTDSVEDFKVPNKEDRDMTPINTKFNLSEGYIIVDKSWDWFFNEE